MRVDLKKTLFILPNLFTCSSIFCGVYAVLLCVGDPEPDDFLRASLLIVFAMFFDLLDGRVARLTKTQSAFGVQLDSLADVLSFGITPSVLAYTWVLRDGSLGGSELGDGGLMGVFATFVYTAAGTIRLARFNVQATSTEGTPKKPGKFIMGLPIPGAAGILVSLLVANHTMGSPIHAVPIMIVMGALAFFMVSTIKFRSFKDLRLGWQTAALVVFAVSSSAFVAIRFHVSFALVWLLSCYIIIGLAESLFSISKRGLKRARQRRQPAEPEEAEQGS